LPAREVAMRWVLDCLYGEALLCLLPYWLWKMPQARRYRAGLRHKFGYAPRMARNKRRLWVHAASVGEASIPRAVIEKFRDGYPEWEVVFSTSTDTGAERLRALYGRAPVFYWPLDFSFCVEQSLERVAPDVVVLVELEVWPNFMAACVRRGVPVVILNGRISQRSSRLLRSLSNLCRWLWEPVRACCARSAEDARRFTEAGLGEERVFNFGSLKYDALPIEGDPEKEDALRRLFGIDAGAPVLVAGSTHPGEEEILCGIYARLRQRHRDLRLVLVPRHIERAGKVAQLIRSQGLPVARKTELDAGRKRLAGDEVILVDTVGDLIACYGLASCVFVGRSLTEPGGGQNMMEPSALGKPVLVGPHTGNFEPEMALLSANDAVRVVRDSAGLYREIDRLLSDVCWARALGERARRVVLQSRGAAEKSFDMIRRVLEDSRLV